MPRSKHRKKPARYKLSKRSHASAHSASVEDRKMSEVLLKFIEPFRNVAHNDSELEKLIGLGVVAWNVSLLPEDQREESLDELARDLFTGRRLLPIRVKNWLLNIISSKRSSGGKAQLPLVGDFKEIVYEMIEYKLERFRQNRRFIVSYHVEAREDEVQLFVASTLEGIGKK